MAIPIEDFYQDILNKAINGLGRELKELGEKLEVSPESIEKVLEGEFDEKIVRALARELDLHADALVALANGTYKPKEIQKEGLLTFNTPFLDMTVNSYLVWNPATKVGVAFDTGADCVGMVRAIQENNLKIPLILLTHAHGDHIADLERLTKETGAKVFINENEPHPGAETFKEGHVFEAGGLKMETRLTSGHSAGGTTYVIHGLDYPLAVVGDSLFAGSMGGGKISYQDALYNNLEKVLALPDATILCPGHGPLTTVQAEKINNPFFAGKL